MDDMLEVLGFPRASAWVLNVAPDYGMELIVCDGVPLTNEGGLTFRRTYTRSGTGRNPFDAQANTVQRIEQLDDKQHDTSALTAKPQR
jgi:hypothetical protein